MIAIDKTVMNCNIKQIGQHFFYTLIFCIFIGFLLTIIEWGNFKTNTFISIGYGLSALFCIHAFAMVFPRSPEWLIIALPSFIGLILGTLNAQYQIFGELSFNSDQLELPKQMFMLGLIFTSIALFIMFYLKKQARIKDLLRQEQLQRAEQEKQLSKSQLQVLQSQIEPHFLFNTLASIQALIGSDPKQASNMLQHLTELLRSSLNSSRSETTTLKQEIELVRAYLDIQKIRFGKRLNFSIKTIDSHFLNKPFPPLMLQPIVENAIKHGIEPKIEGGHIDIFLRAQQEFYQIIITDTGVGLTDKYSSGEGIGLDNVRSRLSSLYGKNATLCIKENQPTGVVCTLMIPINE